MGVMIDNDPLYINALLKAATEQRDEALNEVCRLRGNIAVMRRDMGDLEEKLEAAKKPKPRAKPKPKSPRVKR